MRLSILNVVEVVKSCSNQVAQPHFFILRTQCAHFHFSFLISHLEVRVSQFRIKVVQSLHRPRHIGAYFLLALQ